MHNNEILSRLVDALTLKDDSLAEIFALGGEEMTGADALARTRALGTEGAVACTSDQLGRFLDGLILQKRGPRDTAAAPRAKESEVLKTKLFIDSSDRVAMEWLKLDSAFLISVGF